MLPVLRRQRPEVQAAIAGIGFAAYMLALHMASPPRVIFGAAAFAAAIGITARRRAEGRPELSLPAAAALSAAMWALLVWAFVVRGSPTGWERVPVVLLFLVPAGVLWHAYASARRQ